MITQKDKDRAIKEFVLHAKWTASYLEVMYPDVFKEATITKLDNYVRLLCSIDVNIDKEDPEGVNITYEYLTSNIFGDTYKKGW